MSSSSLSSSLLSGLSSFSSFIFRWLSYFCSVACDVSLCLFTIFLYTTWPPASSFCLGNLKYSNCLPFFQANKASSTYSQVMSMMTASVLSSMTQHYTACSKFVFAIIMVGRENLPVTSIVLHFNSLHSP